MSRDEESYIDVNTVYYCAAFNSMRRRKSFASWNWAAFFLMEYWLVYRKMYLLGIVSIVITSLLVCFGAIRTLSTMIPIIYFIPILHYVNSMVPLVLILVFKITIGVSGNYIYMKHVKRSLREANCRNLLKQSI